MFDNRVLRKIFGYKMDDMTRGREENYMMWSFIICTLHQILLV
jgi:hypothetical protein